MARHVFVCLGGRVVGPLAPAQLRRLAREGRVTSETQVCVDGRRWFRAQRVRGLEFGAAVGSDGPDVAITAADAGQVTAQGPFPPPLPVPAVPAAAQDPAAASPQPAAGEASRPWLRGAASAACWVIAIAYVVNAWRPAGGPAAPVLPRSGASSPVAERTKQAWDELNRVELELESLSRSDESACVEQAPLRYGRLGLDGVDPELRALVREKLDIASDLHASFAAYQQELARIRQGVDTAARFGAAVGAMDHKTPRQSAVAGELFMGLLGAAAADQQTKDLAARYEPVWQQARRRGEAVRAKHTALGQTLSRRYGRTFDLIR